MEGIRLAKENHCMAKIRHESRRGGKEDGGFGRHARYQDYSSRVPSSDDLLPPSSLFIRAALLTAHIGLSEAARVVRMVKD